MPPFHTSDTKFATYGGENAKKLAHDEQIVGEKELDREGGIAGRGESFAEGGGKHAATSSSRIRFDAHMKWHLHITEAPGASVTHTL